MSPPNPYVVAQLRNLIYYHLDNNHLRNALFVAGRLQAYDSRSADAAHLLALCHLRLGQHKLAYERSKSLALRGGHLGCAYIFGEACVVLRDGKEKEGITALDKTRGLWGGRSNWNMHSETTRRHLPDAASVYCLMGKLWVGYGYVDQAIDCYVEAVKLNPFMWDAFLGLCHSGANIRIANIFKMTPELLAILSTTGPIPPDVADDPSSQGPTAPVTGPLKSQHNNHHPAPPPYDPFSGPAGRGHGDGDVSVGNRLFQKTAEGKQAAAAFFRRPTIDEDVVFEGVDTPTGPGGVFDPNGTMGVDMSDPVVVSASAASLRGSSRDHQQLSTLSLEVNEAPANARGTSTRARSRVGSEVEEMSEGPVISRAAAAASSSTSLAGDRKRTISGHAAQSSSQASDVTAAPQRRSVRLFNQSRPTTSKLASLGTGLGFREGRDLKKARATGTKGRTAGHAPTVGRVVSGNRKPSEAMDVDSKESVSTVAGPGTSAAISRSQATEALKQQEALQWLLTLFRYLGTGYYALSHFRCADALQMFGAIPASQRETPWVLSQMGRAYYEQSSYVDAERFFKKVRAMSRSRLEDMEIYSTVLWHLKNEVELAFLAHELVDVDRLSPQAWCSIGNTFSLQRDHDQALKCFRRATQVDPLFSYAFTLQGHEHVANEEYDKALTAYRSAINVDKRHYNAWYGLGNVFEKMGQFEVAQNHFCMAIRINPTNAVLICCLGVVSRARADRSGHSAVTRF